MISARRRVLLLMPTLGGGGAERFFTLLLRYLDRNLFEIHLALLQARGEYIPDIPDDVVVYDLQSSRARYALPRLIRLIWKVRPQSVLSTLPQTNIALTLSRPFLPDGTKLLIAEAAMTSAALKEDFAHPRLWRWFYRRLYKRADKVVCLSDSMVDDLVTNFQVPREKTRRIYYPVDAAKVHHLAEIDGNPYLGPGPHVVAVGRLTRQKGLDLLLDAMAAVRECFPQVQLTILGQGPLLNELTEQARRLGLSETVRFLGFQQNPWRYIRHASLFVLPSRYEGLPNILLETLVLGTPVVATDCPGAIREVQAGNPHVTVVPPEDPPALAQAICDVCEQQKSMVEPHARPPSYLTRFDLHHVVGEYSELLLD